MGGFSFLSVAVLWTWCGATEAAVDGFEYPSGLGPPPELWIEGFASRLHAQGIQKYETPIQIKQTFHLDQAMWNCIARYHPCAVDAITFERPRPHAPAEHHNSEARALCMVHAVNKLVPELVPNSVDIISTWVKDVGLDASIMTDEDARSAADAGDFTPRVLGSVVAADILLFMQTDGWNHLGAIKSVSEDQNIPDTACTANCRPYSDTTGYQPRNNPWEVSDPAGWQPLMETDGNGFFFSQEHVTPHIGLTVEPITISGDEFRSRKLEDPMYNLEDEATLAIARVAALGDFEKAMIEFMDNKISIAGGMITRLRETFSLSLEAQVYYHYGYTSSEHDAVLLAWKEKVAHNLVRPTTTVQARGKEQVSSFASAEPHYASDWTPFLRVMPHAEYPSGSGCICTAVMQYVDAFVQDAYGIDSFETTWAFEPGSSKVQPGVVPAENVVVTFENMEELRNVCGDSRLWGGMHYTASVPDSYELCDGVGMAGYEMMKKLLLSGGGATFEDLMDEAQGITLYTAP